MVERHGAGKKFSKKVDKTAARPSAERTGKTPPEVEPEETRSSEATAATAAKSSGPASDRGDPALSPQPKRRRGRARFWGALVFAGIVAGAVLYGLWPVIIEAIGPDVQPVAPVAEEAPAPGPVEALRAPKPEPAVPEPVVADAAPPTAPLPDGATPTALDTRIGELEQALAEAPALTDDAAIADLVHQLDMIEGRLDEIGAGAAGPIEGELAAGLAGAWSELQALIARLDRLESALDTRPEPETRSLALLLALGQLQDSVARGDPYASDLAALRQLTGTEAALAGPLAALEARAVSGVPTRQALRARFDATARAVVTAAIAPEGAGWVDQTLQKLAGIVSVRRTGGDIEGDSADARIARAEARLMGGELALAVAELEGLRGAAADAAGPWLTDARARLSVNSALVALNRLLIDRLGAGQAAAP